MDSITPKLSIHTPQWVAGYPGQGDIKGHYID